MMRVLKSALLPAALFLAFCCGAEPAPLKVSDGKLTAAGRAGGIINLHRNTRIKRDLISAL